jgi:hypothetical protein
VVHDLYTYATVVDNTNIVSNTYVVLNIGRRRVRARNRDDREERVRKGRGGEGYCTQHPPTR